jgi:hypothetical protein
LLIMSYHRKKIVLYSLRDLHFPVLLPVYHELQKLDVADIGFMAPPYQESNDGCYQEGLRPQTLEYLNANEIPFWGHERKAENYACVVTADVCYDRIDGWGPFVCIGHGTISKGIYFTDAPVSRRENFASVLCVPGPWYRESLSRQVFVHVEPTGFSKMDELAVFDPIKKKQLLQSAGFSPEKKTILFAPTFNPEFTSAIMLFEQWEKLDSKEYQIFFKLHGVTHEKIKLRYIELAASQTNFHYVNESSVVPYMHACDIMVSDVSSVYVEFLALNKPVILVNNPQIKKYHGYNPQDIEYRARNAAYQVNKPEEIHNILRALKLSDPLRHKRREYAGILFPRLDGQNSKRIAEQVIKVAKGERSIKPPLAGQKICIYIPEKIFNTAQIEENIKNALFPLNVFTHQRSLQPSIAAQVLGKNEMPPRPCIIMTGENTYPLHWDYIWFAAEYFNQQHGVFGPMLENGEQNGYQQRKLHVRDEIDRSYEERQAIYKYQLLGICTKVPSLKEDGLIFTKDVPEEIMANHLNNLQDSESLLALIQSIDTLGMHAHVMPGFFVIQRNQNLGSHGIFRDNINKVLR